MLNIIWYLIIGFISGWIAKWIMRVPDVKWWEILILGIVGSIVGGLIARLWSRPTNGRPFHPAGLFMSIVGAIVILGVGRLLLHLI
jgi:uncharacterized membrane protein YeaQ/YmgE (transglycosylase-associated protein family)